MTSTAARPISSSTAQGLRWIASRTTRPTVALIPPTTTPSVVVGGISATVGLVVLLAIQRSPWAVLLLIGLAAVLVMVYRAYAQFLWQHKSMTEIYDLT